MIKEAIDKIGVGVIILTIVSGSILIIGETTARWKEASKEQKREIIKGILAGIITLTSAYIIGEIII